MIFINKFFIISGRQDAGCGCRHIRNPLAAISGHAGVQQFRHNVLATKFP